MRWRRPALMILAGPLVLTSAALAATSAPTPSGHYAGRTSQKRVVNVRVSRNGSEFQGGRIFLLLHGARACAGRAYFDLSPTPPPAIRISRAGRVAFKATFASTPAPGFPFRGKGSVLIRGQFSDHGKLLSGFARERLFNSHGSCTSGRVTFRATRRG